jgi:hypothetical protein
MEWWSGGVVEWWSGRVVEYGANWELHPGSAGLGVVAGPL